MIHFNEVELYSEPRRKALSLIQTIPGEPEMSKFESAFLCGMLKKYCPDKILEVGVAGGATTGIILQCMADLKPDGFSMYSVDCAELFYWDETHRTGFLGEEVKNSLLRCGKSFYHSFYLGNIACSNLEDIGGNIDFLVLDTVHSLPGEILDFITILPYLRDGAVVVLHDINLNHYDFPKYGKSFATGTLLSAVSGEKYLNYDLDRIGQYPNIGAFIVDKSTRENNSDLFLSLILPWGKFPSQRKIEQYRNFIVAHYPEALVRVFDSAVLLNLAHQNKKYHFPFERVPDGRIVLYGRGAQGMAYHEQMNQFLANHRDNYEFTGWIDRHSIQEIEAMEFDYVVVAIEDETTAREVGNKLMSFGVDKGKIII